MGISLLVLGLASQVVLAGNPIDVSGTSWDMAAKFQLKVKKLGKIKDSGVTQLFIGPNATEGIGAGQFKFDGGGGAGDDLVGTYTDPKSKGHLRLEVDLGDLEDMIASDLQEILEQDFTTVEDLDCQITKLKTSAKLKPGKKGQFKMNVKFDVQATLDGEPVESSGSLSVKGKGVEL